ncbi:hypothetical protein ACOTVL_10630 [Aliarcobacter butzleri]
MKKSDIPIKKTSISFTESDYLEFKNNCKLRDSDVTKELNKFIKKYNEESKKIFAKKLES